MPLAVENLTRDSSPEAIQEAISASIATCTREGERDPEQCKAIAYSIARKKTGKPLGRKKTKSRTLAQGP